MTRPHSVANIQLALGAPEPALARIANWTLGLLVLGMLAAAAIRIVANLLALARLEPLQRRQITLRATPAHSETPRATSLA